MKRTKTPERSGERATNTTYRAGDDDAHRDHDDMAFGNTTGSMSPRSTRNSPGLGAERASSDQHVWSHSGPAHSEREADYTGRGPKGYRRSDERIREDACEALERNSRVDASELELEVKDGVVILRGHVEDRNQKRWAESAVEHLSGVRDVRNELSIVEKN